MASDPPRPKTSVKPGPRKAGPAAGRPTPTPRATEPAVDAAPARKASAAPSATPFEPQKKIVRVSGLPAVAALFAIAPERVERLFFEPAIGSRASAFCKIMASARKPYKQVPPEELARVAGTPMHGSIVALAAPRVLPILDPEAAMAQAPVWADAGDPLLVLDGVSNPHNFGAIARTAAFFGVKRIVLSDHEGQALPSDAAYRVARGGLDIVELYQARDITAVLKVLAASFVVVGAALGDGHPPEAFADSPRPIALVMGNEEDGFGPETAAACDAIVTIPGVTIPGVGIPGAGDGLHALRMQSLNVAASSAILIHGLLRSPRRSA